MRYFLYQVAALTCCILFLFVTFQPQPSEEDATSVPALVGQQGVRRDGAAFGVVTLYAGGQGGLVGSTLENKREYCLRHGCALYSPALLASTSEARQHARPHYTKILGVLHALTSPSLAHAWVMWTDADAVFFNTSASPKVMLQESLQAAIPGWEVAMHDFPAPEHPFPSLSAGVRVEEVDVVLTWPLNTGCFLVKNSEWSRQWLQDWFRHDLDGPRAKESRWNDQGALIDLLATAPKAREKVAFVPYPLLAAEWPWYATSSWQVHTPGRPMPQKIDILARIDQERRAIEAFLNQ